ncbi:MAG: efflux RND transporter periplasmic adaptor subunit [Draconibacterium sp.]|nr:efflux RND transporter periplasmic adaptor subunit [Draconibacterium sp.]
MNKINKAFFRNKRMIKLRISAFGFRAVVKPMNKILILLTAAVIIASCSATKTNDETGSKGEQLQLYKQELHDLKQKIEELEKELGTNKKNDIVKVKVAKLKTDTFEHFVEVTGKVEALDDVQVSPETVGIIDEVLVKEGQTVRKGEVLARLNTDILERSLDEVLVQLDLANLNFERQNNLWQQNIGSEMQYLQSKNTKEGLEKRVESLKTQIEMGKIKSPISGVVDVVYQKKGNIGNPQMPFAKVINISRMKVYADISEFYLTKIKKGDVVNIFFPALNREIKAPINQIGNSIDPNNRTFRVRINLNNPDKMIKPNLVSIVKLRDYLNTNAIVIPVLYIKEDLKGSYTYIVEQQNSKKVAKKVYVKTGVTNNNVIEITEGLSAGVQIVTEGYNQIVDGTPLQF